MVEGMAKFVCILFKHLTLNCVGANTAGVFTIPVVS